MSGAAGAVSAAAGGQPGAASGTVRRFAELTVSIAVTDFKLRYYGNALGYVWTLAKPVLLFAVIYLAFTEILDFDTIPHYPEYLITALVIYGYFQETTSTGVGSLVAHESLLRKVPIPPLVIPMAIALRAFFNLFLNLAAVFAFLLITGFEPTLDWLQFPLLIGVLMILSASVASVLANLYVPFRDVGHIWDVVVQMLFWVTPIIYTVDGDRVPEGLRELIMMNPLAVIFTQMRHAVIDPNAPTAAELAGGWERLAIPAGIVIAAVAAAVVLHRRMTPQVAERL